MMNRLLLALPFFLLLAGCNPPDKCLDCTDADAAASAASSVVTTVATVSGSGAIQYADSIRVFHDTKHHVTCWYMTGGYNGTSPAISCLPDGYVVQP